MKRKLFGLTKAQIGEIVQDAGLPRFTTGQICNWLYEKHIANIDDMTNLSKNTRELLKEEYEVGLQRPMKETSSADGTKKYLFKVGEHRFIETAYIPEENRKTLCVSSQVGCKMACGFCMTGKQGFQKHLSANQILNQLRSIPEFESISNIVFMGMGEPLDNIENLMNALGVLTSDWGYGWSPKRINVSTIGLIPAMRHFIENSNCHLAISLHNPFDEERSAIMPVNKKHHLKDIISELRSHDFGRQRRVSFEYIVFHGMNDTPRHVKELARLLNGLRCRINLIRWHSIPGADFVGTNEERLLEFQKELKDKGIQTTIRVSRGQDIDAACGLLSTKELVNEKKST
ncbi:MAG: 23S rRNA (adenine(2503)-C(2))-methyltransferase RlmN [Chlorobi bacterium]|nr:23S rRNA (adenine(2503)-C(2))-methyltransferase RlmN [Chlorobiota bacterium]